MNERAGELDQTLIEGIVGAVAVNEPEVFKDFVGFEIAALIEADEEAEIMGLETLAMTIPGEVCNVLVLLAHRKTVSGTRLAGNSIGGREGEHCEGLD